MIHADERFADLKLMVGGRGDERLTEMPVPDRLTRVLHSRERDRPFGVAQIWSHYAEAIRSGTPAEPDFDLALDLHRLIDALERASDTGTRQVVAR